MGINLGIILGSGIEIDRKRIDDIHVINKDSSGVHKKVRYICSFEGYGLLVIQGRKHFYEGCSYTALTEDIRYLHENEVKNLIITNAAGGVNPNFNVSDLMLIRSYINLNSQMIYKRKLFPYDFKLNELFRSSCMKAKVMLHEGVYGYYQGPTYETKAEIRFQEKYNIDAAGMSTVPESSEASLRRIRVVALSVITNILKENVADPASHEAVISNAKTASENLNKAISAYIPELN